MPVVVVGAIGLSAVILLVAGSVVIVSNAEINQIRANERIPTTLPGPVIQWLKDVEQVGDALVNPLPILPVEFPAIPIPYSMPETLPTTQAQGGSSGGGSVSDITQFSANRLTVAYGQSITLSWRVTNADLVSINGQNYDLTGTVTFVPEVSGNYVLTVYRLTGITTRTIRITVSQAPSYIWDEPIYLDTPSGNILDMKLGKNYEIEVDFTINTLTGSENQKFYKQLNFTNSGNSIYINNYYLNSRKITSSGSQFVLEWQEDATAIYDFFNHGGEYSNDNEYGAYYYLPLELIYYDGQTWQRTSNALQLVYTDLPNIYNPVNGTYFNEALSINMTRVRVNEVVDLNPVIQRLDSLNTRVTAVEANTYDTKVRVEGIGTAVGDGVSVEGLDQKVSVSAAVGTLGLTSKGNVLTLAKHLNSVGKAVKLSQIANLFTMATVVHNAAMLSNDLVFTLGSVIDNFLAIIGLSPKDEDGEVIPVLDMFSNWLTGFANSLIGEQNTAEIKRNWNKAMRIYQAGANIVWSIQSIGFSIAESLEVIGEWNANIGNALRKWGVVAERAYAWMNPDVDFSSKFFTRLEQAQEIVDGLSTITEEVLDARETYENLSVQREELEASIKDGLPGQPRENIPIKEAEAENKRVSQDNNIDFDALVPGEENNDNPT